MISSHTYANDIISRLFIHFQNIKNQDFVYQSNFLQEF